MNEQDMKVQAKAMALVLAPIIERQKSAADEQLDLVQDLQDRVSLLEQQVRALLAT